MPLIGQAKADYQREYMRGYMRRKRVEGLNTKKLLRQDLQPQGLNIGLNKPPELVEAIEIDADGNPIPEY